MQTTAQLRNSEDRIYFANMNWRIETLDRETKDKSNFEIQKSVDFKGQVDKNFLQSLPTPGYPKGTKENANVRPDIERVYLHLQPGLFLNDPNYYGNRFNDDIAAFRPTGQVPMHSQALAQVKPSQTQPQLQPQKGQSQVFNQQVQPVRPSNSQSPDIQQNSQSSEQNSQIPGQNVQVSGQNGPIPGQNVQMPGQNVQAPGQNVHISGQNDQIPSQNVQIPGQNIQIPLQIPTTQSHEGNTPVSRAVTNFGLNLLRVRLK